MSPTFIMIFNHMDIANNFYHSNSTFHSCIEFSNPRQCKKVDKKTNVCPRGAYANKGFAEPTRSVSIRKTLSVFAADYNKVTY